MGACLGGGGPEKGIGPKGVFRPKKRRGEKKGNSLPDRGKLELDGFDERKGALDEGWVGGGDWGIFERERPFGLRWGKPGEGESA